MGLGALPTAHPKPILDSPKNCTKQGHSKPINFARERQNWDRYTKTGISLCKNLIPFT
jgi:hypothetical protein